MLLQIMIDGLGEWLIKGGNKHHVSEIFTVKTDKGQVNVFDKRGECEPINAPVHHNYDQHEVGSHIKNNAMVFCSYSDSPLQIVLKTILVIGLNFILILLVLS